MANKNVECKMVCPRYGNILPTTSPLPQETLDYVGRILQTGDTKSLPPVVLFSYGDAMIPYDGSTRLTKSYETGISIPGIIIFPGGTYDLDTSFIGGGTETLVYDDLIDMVLACKDRASGIGINTWEDQLNRVKKRNSVSDI